MQKHYQIEKATLTDVDALEMLYDAVNEVLENGTNYAGWKKGVYPVRETAIDGIQAEALFVCRIGGEVAGTVILNHEMPEAYSNGKWQLVCNTNEVMVVHTLAIHPCYGKKGVAQALLEFARDYCKAQGAKVIRLDTWEHNAPAIRLYERCGYAYRGMVDLGLGIPELVWFKLYELIL